MKNIGSFHCNMRTKQAGFEQNFVDIYHKHPNNGSFHCNKGTLNRLFGVKTYRHTPQIDTNRTI